MITPKTTHSPLTMTVNLQESEGDSRKFLKNSSRTQGMLA